MSCNTFDNKFFFCKDCKSKGFTEIKGLAFTCHKCGKVFSNDTAFVDYRGKDIKSKAAWTEEDYKEYQEQAASQRRDLRAAIKEE